MHLASVNSHLVHTFVSHQGEVKENVLAFDLGGNGSNPSLYNFLKYEQTEREGRREKVGGRKEC